MDIKTPTCKVLANGKDITGMILGKTRDNESRLILLRITDQRGYESDSLSIELDDTDGKVAHLKKGAELEVYLGFLSATGDADRLHHKGKYLVDEFSHDGPPDKVLITANAADMLTGLKLQKTRSWDEATLGAILRQIASEHGLTPAIATEFDNVTMLHFDQINESDLHVITRLGQLHDAVVKPASGHLVFVKKGASTSAGGHAHPVITINRNEVSSHHYLEKGRTEHTGVRAYWHDTSKVKRTGVIVGTQVRLKNLSGTFASADAAKQAAQAELDRLQRDGSELNLTLEDGRPELVAEATIKSVGFRSYIDNDWVIGEIVHELSGDRGLSSTIKAERPNT